MNTAHVKYDEKSSQYDDLADYALTNPRRAFMLTLEFAAGAAVRPLHAEPSPLQLLWVDPDDQGIEAGLQMLRRHGFEVARAASAAEAQAALGRSVPALVILETALPDADGLALCRQLSEAETAPVLLMSACADTLDRVAGLDFGADDYLAKTAHPLELLARVRALLRRVERHARRTAEAPAWRFDAELGYVTSPSGRTVRLSPADAGLLAVLAERPGEVRPRAELLARLHGDGSEAGGRSIDARVARLRRSLSACDGAGELIKTLRGGGYVFHAQVRRDAAWAA
jgi:two-component system OmpR family response regulator